MRNPVDTLSERENEVYDLVVLGWSNAKIADELGVSLSTAKYHLGNICHKLGLDSRAEVIAQHKGEGASVGKGRQTSAGTAYTAEQIKAAAALVVEKGCGPKRVVNQVVLDILAALEDKL